LLEDRAAFRDSLARRDPIPAYDYYVRNASTETGFQMRDPASLDFMRHWTLAVHLYDLHEVVKAARKRAKTVVLGGHSLGGSQIGYYAAFDVEPGPELVPGYHYLDGLVLIDGALGRTGGFAREPDGLKLGPLELLPGTEGLQQGEGSPYLTFGLSPDFFARREAEALMARFLPAELAPNADFPQTNRALIGIREDDEYSPSTVFSSSFGHAIGAKVGGNLTAVLLGGFEGVRNQTVVGVADGFEAVDWGSGDLKREKSDLNAVVRSWSTAETNRSEWYFPLRLALDIGQYDVRLESATDFVLAEEVTTPTLAIGAGRGLIPSLEGFAAYFNSRPGSLFSPYIVPGMTHLDIVQATDTPVVAIFARWLEQVKSPNRLPLRANLLRLFKKA
jgi:pimeloyl-ACP methyl ester carboxylesterase